MALAAEEEYYGLQGALWNQATVEEIIKQADSLRQLAQARFEVGLARKYDVAQAEARLAEAELMRASAANQVTQARGKLAQVLGMDVRAELAVPALPAGEENATLADVDWLMELAQSRRPELVEARATVEQALASTRMAEAGYWPSVTGDAGVTASWDSRTDTSVPWSAGVGVSVPLFSGFDTTHAVRRARYDEKAAREQLSGLVSDIQFEVLAARANVV